MNKKNEIVGPCIIFAAGIALFIFYAYALIGADSVGPVLEGVLIKTAISVVFNIIVCYIASIFMGSLGYLHTAILKLAAISVFTSALAVVLTLIPLFGLLILIAVYLGLLEWFFELDIGEVIVLALLIFIIHIAIVDVVYAAILAKP